MIGLDGASLPFIEAHAPALPVLRRLLDTSVVHHLRSRSDTITGSMWPNFFTGDHSGVHGYYHDLAWDPYRMCLRRVTRATVDYAPFWHRFDAAGLSVIAIDVPHALPSLSRGVEVIAWNAHDHMTPFAVQPRALQGEIRQRFGGHTIGYEIPSGRTLRQLRHVRDRLVESARRKGELCRWLLRQRSDWDFFIAVFAEVHRGGHLLWPHASPPLTPSPPDALLDVYRALDRAVGQLIDALRESGAMTMLFAPNGMGQNCSLDHFGLAIMDRINQAFLAREGIAAVRDGTSPRSLTRQLRRLVPDRVQQGAGQLTPVWLRDQIVNRTFTGGRDWSRTPALTVRGDVHTYVRYNLRGREAAGMLEPGSALLGRYEEFLEQCFRSLHDADSGEPVVRTVRFARDVYPGPRSHLLPDAIAAYHYAAPARRLASPLLGIIDADFGTGRSGNHRPEGFCLVLDAHGEFACADSLTHVRDLAPMVVRHYGISN